EPTQKPLRRDDPLPGPAPTADRPRPHPRRLPPLLPAVNPRPARIRPRRNLTKYYYSAHRYPDVVRAVAEAGHEIAHHSYFHENTIGMDAKTEAAMIDLGLRALRDVAGVRPDGYRAPLWEMNYHTPRLLADRGFS